MALVSSREMFEKAEKIFSRNKAQKDSEKRFNIIFDIIQWILVAVHLDVSTYR